MLVLLLPVSQVYELAPLAVNTTDAPGQIALGVLTVNGGAETNTDTGVAQPY